MHGEDDGLPGVARVAAHQLDDPACVADGAVGQQEEQPGVAALQGLPQGPVERGQEVGPAHVRPHPLDVLTSQGQRVLAGAMRAARDRQVHYTMDTMFFFSSFELIETRAVHMCDTQTLFHSVMFWGKTFELWVLNTRVVRFVALQKS